MKRRALILVLTLVLLVGMFPVTASAASDFTTSDAGVDLIKHFEGFSKYPYWDYEQYTVGYGTRCPDDKLEEYRANGITKEEAEALLQKELRSFESTLNKFIDKYDLKWNQAKFDAMLSLTYNCGGSWTTGASSHLFTQYVIAGKTGNDFIFAISLWSNAGGSMSIGLVKRRLIEANLYLNGVYDTEVPENYHYVKFSHTDSIYEGTARSIKLQGYDSSLAGDLHVRPEGKKSGYRFLGWYTAATGGEWIETLTAKMDGKTLYPHWQEGDGNKTEGTEASYSRTASGSVKIYAEPSLDAKVTGTISKGTVMNFVADYVDADGVKWGRLKQGGWVCLSKVTTEKPETSEPTNPTEPSKPTEPPVEEEKVIATGTVKLNDGTLNIRSGPDSSYSKVGALSNGAKVEIYEIKNGWGRISKGWISMEYVVLDEAEKEPEVKPDPFVAKGLVNTTTSLSIRKGAGASYKKVGSLASGSLVEIYETVTVDGIRWGRVSKGWISLKYVKLATRGTVTSSTLKIRAAAGSDNAQVGSYKKGDAVFVYETTKVGSATWGHTDEGWSNLKFVQLASANAATGYVKSNSLKIRAAAGSDNDQVGSYAKGDVVTVYETAKVGSSTWACTDVGWVNMKYLQMDADTKPITGKVTCNTLNARAGTGTDYESLAKYKKGETVKVYQTLKVDDINWGRTTKGWVNMKYVDTTTQSQTQTTTPTRTGTVTASGSLNVRKGAGAGYDKVGSVKSGDKLTITTLKLVDGSAWGKISSGWVCLDYVKMDKPAAGAPALIMGSDLNIRKGAGKSYSVVDQYDKGVVVTILETKTVDGTTWGRTDKGWVSMTYVL